MDTTHTNGHPLLRPSGPDGILYHHAQSLGRIEARLDTIDRRITKLEDNSMLGFKPIQFIQIGIGITVVGASMTGQISWVQGLPILGRVFGGG